MNGASNDDNELFTKSGAEKLADAIRSFLNQGGGKLRLLESTDTVGMYASRMGHVATDRLGSLLSKGNEDDQVFRERIDSAKADLRQVEREWDEAKSSFDADCRKMERDFDHNLEEKLEEARKELKLLLDEGSIDGERFGRAITEKIQTKARSAQDELDRTFRATTQTLVDALRQLRCGVGGVRAKK